MMNYIFLTPLVHAKYGMEKLSVISYSQLKNLKD